jgi:glyoxylase-like metal-dependent hydrolase (beta-lactamase superfamily II)
MASSSSLVPPASKSADYAVAPGVTGLRILFVNVFFVSAADTPNSPWVLVDAGLRGSADRIKRAAAERFGSHSKPAAILLTHGHFDHVGALHDLLTEWDVPVYAHPLELPYLTGRSDYPPPDPTVGGGGMAWLSWIYPNSATDFQKHLRTLPADNHVPGLPDWRWIHTPGHAPGHVSFFRESDRTLLAGDAFVTTKQESVWSVITQKPEIHGPPAYFTINWEEAHGSVGTLAKLNPAVAATGHGIPMRGEEMQQALSELAQHFSERSVPATGRYVHQPVQTNEEGVVTMPPATVSNVTTSLLLGFGVAFLASFVLFTAFGSGNKSH